MTEALCFKCRRVGSLIYSRCGHILHEYCFKKTKECPLCYTVLSNSYKIECLFVKIKDSNLKESEKEKLSKCLERFFNKKCEYVHFDAETLIKLQAVGWDINENDCGGPNIFYRACYTDDIERVNLLIEHGLDLEKYGKRGLNDACLSSSSNTFERLRNLDIEFDSDIIFRAISKNNFKAMKFAVEHGADVNSLGIGDERPIQAAAKRGSVEFFDYLVQHGADFSAVDSQGDTILHYAAVSNKTVDLLEHLRESGFDLRVKNKTGATPLMQAILSRNHMTAEYLIENMDDINDTDDNGQTALHYLCVRDGSPYILIKALLIKGANVNARDNKGKTPLHLLDIESNETIKLLLDNGADKHAKDNNGKVPYQYLYWRWR